jgi:hypothetical protein
MPAVIRNRSDALRFVLIPKSEQAQIPWLVVKQLFDGFDVLQLSDGINTDGTAFGWVIWILLAFFVDGIWNPYLAKLILFNTVNFASCQRYFADYSLNYQVYPIDIILYFWKKY